MCVLKDAPNPRLPAHLQPFNSQTARAAALKRHNAERLRKAMRRLEVEQPPADPRLTLVVEQIALTRAALGEKIEPKDRAQLVRALCGLLDRERILRGEPLPGSRKPAPEPRQRQVEQPMAPVPVAPVLHETQSIAAKPIESGQSQCQAMVRETAAEDEGSGI